MRQSKGRRTSAKSNRKSSRKQLPHLPAAPRSSDRTPTTSEGDGVNVASPIEDAITPEVAEFRERQANSTRPFALAAKRLAQRNRAAKQAERAAMRLPRSAELADASLRPSNTDEHAFWDDARRGTTRDSCREWIILIVDPISRDVRNMLDDEQLTAIRSMVPDDEYHALLHAVLSPQIVGMPREFYGPGAAQRIEENLNDLVGVMIGIHEQRYKLSGYFEWITSVALELWRRKVARDLWVESAEHSPSAPEANEPIAEAATPVLGGSAQPVATDAPIAEPAQPEAREAPIVESAQAGTERSISETAAPVSESPRTTADASDAPVVARDHSWIDACGTVHYFESSLQREIIRVLFGEWKRAGGKDGRGLHADTIAESTDHQRRASRLRIDKLFAHHTAMGTVLRSVGRNQWALFLLEPAPSPNPPKDQGKTKDGPIPDSSSLQSSRHHERNKTSRDVTGTRTPMAGTDEVAAT